jgi:hypothetical protein
MESYDVSNMRDTSRRDLPASAGGSRRPCAARSCTTQASADGDGDADLLGGTAFPLLQAAYPGYLASFW